MTGKISKTDYEDCGKKLNSFEKFRSNFWWGYILKPVIPLQLDLCPSHKRRRTLGLNRWRNGHTGTLMASHRSLGAGGERIRHKHARTHCCCQMSISNVSNNITYCTWRRYYTHTRTHTLTHWSQLSLLEFFSSFLSYIFKIMCYVQPS